MIKPSIVSEFTLRRVQTPAWTDSWHPVPHHQVHEMVLESLEQFGEADPIRLELTRQGSRFFGLYSLISKQQDLQYNQNGYTLQIGVRNSLDKSFALGIVSGYQVVVCSNLAFYGERKELRRHTAGLTKETLGDFIDASCKQVYRQAEEGISWMESLQEVPCHSFRSDKITIKIFEEKILPGSQFLEFRKELKSRYTGEYGETFRSLYEAATAVLRDKSIGTVMNSTRKLELLFREEIRNASTG